MGKVVFNLNYTSAKPPNNLTPDRKADYIARRKFYNLTAEYNYFTYSLADKKVQENATAEDYFTKSTGLFNLDGKIDDDGLAKLKEKLRTTESIIWHGVISFDEETSKSFETEDAAIKFMQRTFGAFVDKTSLDKDNIELYASLHKDTDNRHIHFAFFEREPKHLNTKGERCYTQKGNFGKGALLDFLVSSNMHLSKDKDLYYTARNAMIDKMKTLRGDGNYVAEVKKLLTSLAKDLPKTGRLQYNAEDMQPLRGRIDEISETVLRSDAVAYESHKQVLQEISAREKKAREICLANSFAIIGSEKVTAMKLELTDDFCYIDKATGAKVPLTVDDKAWGTLTYIQNLRRDYYARLGNQVIGMAIDVRKQERTSAKKGGKTPNGYNDRKYKATRRASRTSTEKTVKRCLRELPKDNLRESHEYLYHLKEIEREQERKQNEKISS